MKSRNNKFPRRMTSKILMTKNCLSSNKNSFRKSLWRVFNSRNMRMMKMRVSNNSMNKVRKVEKVNNMKKIRFIHKIMMKMESLITQPLEIKTIWMRNRGECGNNCRWKGKIKDRS